MSISLLLAVGSGWVLVSRHSGLVTDLRVLAFDSLECFIRDTVRLSSIAKIKKNVISQDVFVAP